MSGILALATRPRCDNEGCLDRAKRSSSRRTGVHCGFHSGRRGQRRALSAHQGSTTVPTNIRAWIASPGRWLPADYVKSCTFCG